MLEKIGQNAKVASRFLAVSGSTAKNTALTEISKSLIESIDVILEANKKDIENAKANNITEALIDRLTLTKARVEAIAKSVLEIVGLSDPIGIIDEGFTAPNGLIIEKTRVPLGVIGIIYEARPNVTVDAAVLCIKSGNAVILRGGKEAINSNISLVKAMQNALQRVGFPHDCVQLIEDTSRESANALMKLNAYLDVLIPRGGASLINAVVNNSTVPVIETGVGNCHIYVHSDADIQMAINIIDNAKTSRPSVCNAAESLLVHKDKAKELLPRLKTTLDKHNVELRGCNITREILGDCVISATEEDYYAEFLDYILAVKVVNSIDDAIMHINKYSTKHSEAIITDSLSASKRFTNEIDAAAVYVNASTRFTDGGEFGLGAEIGISTQKLHARGPMGLRELTTIKYIVSGNGQIR